jgi:DNA-binding transcriptional LysR family regulator
MQDMDWGDLPFFLAVAEYGTLARAGALLRIDPTTVGRRIQKLERSLEARLFEHLPAGYVLTPAGERLLQKARAMERIAAEARQAGGGIEPATNLAGTVRLSVSEGFGSWFVARKIGDFARRHPAVSVDLVANSGFLNPTRRETDLAVLLALPRKGPLVTRKLTDYALGLYAAREYLAETGPVNRREMLSGQRLIGYVPDIVYAPELRYLDEIPNAGPVNLRSSSINAQHRMIAAGAGIGVLPHFIGAMDPTLAPILPGIRILRSFWLVAHKETSAYPQVRAMMNWLHDTVKAEQQLFLPPI